MILFIIGKGVRPTNLPVYLPERGRDQVPAFACQTTVPTYQRMFDACNKMKTQRSNLL